MNPDNDADFEQYEMEQTAARLARLRRRGICTHGATLAHRSGGIYYEQEHMLPGEILCRDCGRVFKNEDEWWRIREEVSA